MADTTPKAPDDLLVGWTEGLTEEDLKRPISVQDAYELSADIAEVLSEAIRDLQARLGVIETTAKMLGGGGAPRWAGVWSSHRGYVAGDLVARNQGLFIAKANVAPGEQPAQSDSWQLIMRGPK